MNARLIYLIFLYFVLSLAGQVQAQTANWTDPALNNFRQNVQGALDPTIAPDLTVQPQVLHNCDADGDLEIQVRVCNRGASATTDGILVHFYLGHPGLDDILCSPVLPDLDPGQCSNVVTCLWHVQSQHLITVVADPLGAHTECHEANSAAVFEGVTCQNLD